MSETDESVPQDHDLPLGNKPRLADQRGSVHLEWRRCGQPNCRCARGYLHGPYYARRWREQGRQRKELVRLEELTGVLTAVEERKGLGPVSRIIESLRRTTL